MKKLNVLISSILAASLLVAGGAAAGGCKKHKHSYESGWTSVDETYHWHAPTCDDTEEGTGKTEHNFTGGYKCVDCGFERPVKLSISKATTQYKLVNSLTANIQLNDLEVSINEDDGTKTPLAADQYTLKYYKGDVEVTDLSKATSGAYNIWAYATVDNKVEDTFLVVYVVDEVTEFARADGAKRTQDLGLDVISATWNFNVTYSSGAVKTVNVSDEHIVRVNFSTYIANASGNATVIYSETNCIGETQSLQVKVPYTITTNPNSNVIYNKYVFNAIKATLPVSGENGQTASRVSLAQSNFVNVEGVGDNSFLTLVGTADYRGPTNNVLEIKGDSLTVTFTGVGVLTIGARSTSNSDYSTIAVKDSTGDYVMATYSANNKNVSKDDDYYIYTVTGQDENLLNFEINKPGTYTICTLTEANIEGSTIDTNRYTRVMTLEKTDVLTNTSKGDE